MRDEDTTKDGIEWTVSLRQNETAAIVGLLADGSVAGLINTRERNAGQLVVWTSSQRTEALPWISGTLRGFLQSTTANMSRYTVFATDDGKACEDYGVHCKSSGRWIVFDRRLQAPIVDRVFPKNGRASLSPDGLHYASFESGELRICSLPQGEDGIKDD